MNKKIIVAFAVMGAVIVGLIVALVATNLPKSEPVAANPAVNSSEESADSENAPSDDPATTAAPSEPLNSEESTAETAATDSTAVPSESAPDLPSTTSKPATTTNPAESNGYTLSWSVDSSWETTGATMYGLKLGISNNSGGAISGWKLELSIDGLSVCDGWNGTYTISGNTLTITNADYNGDIGVGGSVSVGCNLGTTKQLSITSAKLNGVSCAIAAGTVPENPQGNSLNNSNNNNNNGNSSAVSANKEEMLARSEDAVQGDDWLHTDGNKILDKNGKQVWLTGVNWFGYNTGTNTFDGLWASELKSSVKAIADHGFNLIRVPISAELINKWAAGEYPSANFNQASNAELVGLNSLEIFDYFLKLAEENGMKVMPDIHCAETNAMGHTVNLWYTDKVSFESYCSALEWLADRYKNNDTIIAIDLKNEPHGKPYEGSNAAIWNDSNSPNNWKYAAEQAAARVLAKNPNLLIMVEGTEIYSKKNGSYSSTNDADYYFNWWGGNLRGVKDYPVDLGKYQNKLVYSPHDYGPTVYEQPWFKGGYTYDSLMKDCWRDNWLYIHTDNTAPLLIGEWGGFMTEPNLTWMTYMRKLISTYHLNHTFWCYNANSGDTGGLVLDDFTTWDEKKYNFVKEVLWQEGGKFVGLDHAIPLGSNGITLAEAKGLS